MKESLNLQVQNAVLTKHKENHNKTTNMNINMMETRLKERDFMMNRMVEEFDSREKELNEVVNKKDKHIADMYYKNDTLQTQIDKMKIVLRIPRL
jgi:hypothetical protein